ncbi:MAG: L-seryl-tRNA(Sec) selenium transferase [Gemmatimonadota bacterium]
MSDPRRRIPGVDALLESEAFRPLLERSGRDRLAELIRSIQARVRSGVEGGGVVPEEPEWYASRVGERLARLERPSLGGVINATGVVLHTNLGRAPLAGTARRAMVDVAGYTAVEYDLARGQRGSRSDHCAPLLRELTGAEAALVVNNNAAAVVLALNTLAEGREVVVSRGELVEIGGSFRIPDIMERSGARLREVGTTNRTHAKDYRAALAAGAALILKVHRSNFRVEGFTAEVAGPELAGLAREAGVTLLHDLGSGALLDLGTLGLPNETTAGAALAAGADVVTMSGDKLLGGPQAGIILGGEEPLARMRANPLYRAFRPDKLTLAALDATLALYLDPDRARAEVPVLRMLGADPDTLAERARDLAARLRAGGVDAQPVPVTAAVGGGAYPGVELPGTAVAVRSSQGAERLAERLRGGTPPVIGRIRDDCLLLDPRTVPEAEESALVDAVVRGAQR